MPTRSDWPGLASRAAAVLAIVALVAALAAVARPAGAQEAPQVTIAQSWGLQVDLPAGTKTVTRQLVTSCEEAAQPIGGGWDVSGPGAADVTVTGSYPAQVGPGGSWLVEVTRRPATGRPAAVTVTPYVVCVIGAGQAPG